MTYLSVTRAPTRKEDVPVSPGRFNPVLSPARASVFEPPSVCRAANVIICHTLESEYIKTHDTLVGRNISLAKPFARTIQSARIINETSR